MEQEARRKGLRHRVCTNIRVVVTQSFLHCHVFFEEKGYHSTSVKQRNPEKRSQTEKEIQQERKEGGRKIKRRHKEMKSPKKGKKAYRSIVFFS
jgi:hypothetical protein